MFPTWDNVRPLLHESTQNEPERVEEIVLVLVLCRILDTVVRLQPLVGGEPRQHVYCEGDEDKHQQGRHVHLHSGAQLVGGNSRVLTSLVKGSRKARREGGAARGLTYKMEMPRFIQGIEKAKSRARSLVMLMSAMQKSAVPSITSPSIPFQLPDPMWEPYCNRQNRKSIKNKTSTGSYRSCAAVLHFTNLLGLFRTGLVKFG